MEGKDPQCICCRCGKPFGGKVEGEEYAPVMTWPLWCDNCLAALRTRAEMFKRLSLAVN